MKLHATCIQTHNIKIMVDFYKKILGYEPTVDGGVDFRFLDNQLIIFKLDNEKAPPTTNVALIYDVEDVDFEYSRLLSFGIASNPPTDKPWGVRSFIVNDPDSNVVSFIESI